MRVFYKGNYYFISKKEISKYIPIGLICYYNISKNNNKLEIRFYDSCKNELRPREQIKLFRYAA